uniref:Uncharacterized protein n=1 Tax=Meloidogyne enterolobii TaxID=390850 RepID=A0A6V7VU51_MELEN|nr:unnamed protein product [Meloidogyne enterolobii]
MLSLDDFFLYLSIFISLPSFIVYTLQVGQLFGTNLFTILSILFSVFEHFMVLFTLLTLTMDIEFLIYFHIGS